MSKLTCSAILPQNPYRGNLTDTSTYSSTLNNNPILMKLAHTVELVDISRRKPYLRHFYFRFRLRDRKYVKIWPRLSQRIFNVGGRVIHRCNRLGVRYNISKNFPGQTPKFGVSPQPQNHLHRPWDFVKHIWRDFITEYYRDCWPLKICKISLESHCQFLRNGGPNFLGVD